MIKELEFNRYCLQGHCDKCGNELHVSAPTNVFKGIHNANFNFIKERSYCCYCHTPVKFDHIFFYGTNIVS